MLFKQVLSLVVLAALVPLVQGGEAVWPGFRGTGDSHAGGVALPLTWSDTANITWTCKLPGYGQSSPVVWKDRAFVTGVKGENKETLVVAAVSLSNGQVEWQQELPASQTVKMSDYVSKGAPTPAVDADRVYVLFESGDAAAFTHDGKPVWTRSLTKDYGPIQGNHGLGSSPAQTADTLIVLFDHSGPSYLAALSKATGETVWKKDRDSRVSWSSPIVAPGADGLETFVSSNGVVQCFSAKDGALLWEVAGLKGNTVASPSVSAETVLVGSGEQGHTQLIRRGGKGDVTSTHVVWHGDGLTSSFGSPLVSDGRAWVVSKAGVATAASLETGKPLWTQRLPDSTWASPLAVGDRVYFFCKNGETLVVRNADQFEKLAQNKLTIEGRLYGVAVAGERLVLRTGQSLICVGK